MSPPSLQPLNRLINTGSLADIDNPIVPAGLDELLHSIGVALRDMFIGRARPDRAVVFGPTNGVSHASGDRSDIGRSCPRGQVTKGQVRYRSLVCGRATCDLSSFSGVRLSRAIPQMPLLEGGTRFAAEIRHTRRKCLRWT
jgi:hypothetical protein